MPPKTKKTTPPAYSPTMTIPDRTGGQVLAKMPTNDQLGFIQFAYPRNYNILRLSGLDVDDAKEKAKYMTIQQAGESTYGTSSAFKNKHNRSGFMLNGSVVDYPSHDQNDRVLYKNFNDRPNWRRAIDSKTFDDYLINLQTPKAEGEYRYESHMTDPMEYKRYLKTLKSFNRTIEGFMKSGATDKYSMAPVHRFSLEDESLNV